MKDIDAANLALLIFRMAVGGVFVAHGVNHIFGGVRIEGTARWFEGLGMHPGWVRAWTASTYGSRWPPAWAVAPCCS